MKRDPALPRWRARNEREREAFVVWTLAKLDEPPRLSEEEAKRRMDETLKFIREGGPQAQAAREGHIGPARALIRQHFPYLADFVKLLPLRRGEKHRRKQHFGDARAYRRSRVAEAAADVSRIKEIWRANYPDHKNRSHDDGASAIEIAARCHNVSIEEVASRLKKQRG